MERLGLTQGAPALLGRATTEIIRLQAECAALKQAAHRAIVDCAGLVHKADRLESELDEARGNLELLDPRG
jgi:phage shock protein A